MWKNMKIRARMISSYLIITALMIIVSITAIIMLNRVGESLSSFYSHQFQTVDQSWTARRSTYAVQSHIQRAMLSTDAADTQSSIASAKESLETIQSAIDKLHDTFQGDANLLTKVDGYITDITPVLNKICDLAGQNQDDEAFAMFVSDFDPIAEDIRSALSQVAEQADSNAVNRVEEAESVSSASTILIISMLLVAIILCVVLGLLISEGIRKPVLAMRQASLNIVEGNLNASIDYHSKDELGDLAENMRNMAAGVRDIIHDIGFIMQEMANGNFRIHSENENAYRGDYRSIFTAMKTLHDTMNETLVQINQSSEQVSAGSDQVAAGAQALSQGAAEQASSVQELAATINDISTHITQTADLANVAKEEDVHAHDELQACSGHMGELVKAINVINEKSGEISKIIKTIEDISFQTNILALNAAVEAARAGSAGKGFAVVADEVRNLASKSAEAAKSTTALIEETIQAVAEGTRLSSATEASLSNVVTDAQNVLEAVTNIAKASNEQAEAVAQVTQGIDQISSVVQTNSATAEQSAAASEELSGQAQMLKELVGKFQLAQSMA